MIKIILVALDSSELSDRVIETIKELQPPPATKIILAHVIAPRNSDVDIAADRPGVAGVIEEIPFRHIEKQLESYQAQLAYPSDLEIVSGDPAEEIIRLANIHQADLIVLGNRGLTGLKRILQGSVSSQVVADAPCSVLVVKPKN